MPQHPRPVALAQYHSDPSALVFFRLFRKHFDLRVENLALESFSPTDLGDVDLVIVFTNQDQPELSANIARLQRYCAPKPLLVVGSGDAFDTGECLRQEVYDYLSVQTSPVELLARLGLMAKKLSRGNEQNKIFVSARVSIDAKYQQVIVDGKGIFLSPLEYKILVALNEHRERGISRQEIVDKVWGKGFAMNSRSVDSHISRLRTKVEAAGLTIEVKRGAGYFLRITE